jgi:hypothetical protein
MAVVGDRLWSNSRTYFHILSLSLLTNSPLLVRYPQIPQLWESSMRLYGGTEASSRRVSSIAEVEAEQERAAHQRADDKIALADTKTQGKEAVATVRAWIAQEQATASHTRQLEKLRIATERKEEKARIAAEKRVGDPFLLLNIHLTLFNFRGHETKGNFTDNRRTP